MKQRLLSALLAALLLLGLAPAALAAPPAEEEAAQALAALDIMVGDETGDLALDRVLTRAEFAKLAVAASTSRDTVGDTVAVKPYPDVPQSHWAAPYIQAAVELGLVQGDLRGYFNPDRSITLAEGVTVVLRLLGYADSQFSGAWPSGQMAQYRALDLDEGLSLGQDDALTRRDALYLFYNLLLTKNTSGVYYLNVLEPTLNLVGTDGTLDRVALVNSAMEGPVVAAAGWQSALPFDAASAAVYRDGKTASLQQVLEGDVLYWSKSMRTLWAYSDKVTGTYEAVSPSAAAPTSVTVAGRTYAIETADAAYALSDLGQWRVGDTLTLLLGRTGGVAAVAGGLEGEDALLCGVVTAVENAAYDGGNGTSYTARTVTLCATNGGSYRYQTDNQSLEVGDLVQVDTAGAAPTLTKLSRASLTGKMNAAGDKLGSYPLAEDVEILDSYEERTPIRVYPQRLAGISFTGDMVRWYQLNGQGEICRLILQNVTGDLHLYGVLTEVEEVDVSMPGAGFVLSSSYTYLVKGQEQVFGSANTVYNLSKGPCQVVMDGDASIEKLVNLSQRKLTSVTSSYALGSDGVRYALSETADFYVEKNGDYQLTTLARIQEGDYTLTGWYDKDESAGGRIRIVVAR